MVALRPFRAVRPSYEFAKNAIDKTYTYEEIKNDIDGGKLFWESKPMLYIYSQKAEISQIAIIGEISCTGSDLPDGSCHMAFIYKENEQTKKLVCGYMTNNAPDYEVTLEDGSVHELWAIKDDNVINGIVGLFEKMDRLYYVTEDSNCQKIPKRSDSQESSVIAHLYSSESFKAVGTRVLIDNLNGNSIVEFLKKIQQAGFEVKKVTKNDEACDDASFKMYIDEGLYMLSYNESKGKSLDVTIDAFCKKILSQILGINDLTDQSCIKIMPDFKKTEKSTVTFLFRGFTADEIINLPDKNKEADYKFVNLCGSLDKGFIII